MAADPCAEETNKEWYRAHRDELIPRKWYIIDNGALAAGPFETDFEIAASYDTDTPIPCSENAFIVRAGPKYPELIDETYHRCARALLRLRDSDQHRKLRFIEDLLGDMFHEMYDHSERNGKQKDRAWPPHTQPPSVVVVRYAARTQDD